MLLKNATSPDLKLVPLPAEMRPGSGGPVFRLRGSEHILGRVTRAVRTFLDMGRSGMPGSTARGVAPDFAASAQGFPAVFREQDSGLIRLVYREVVIRFVAGTSDSKRKAILADRGLAVRRQNRLIPDQIIAYDTTRNQTGGSMVELANALQGYEEVVFATPNFISEYRRSALPGIIAAQWHLKNLARRPGQHKGEDIQAALAWKTTLGRKDVVVAVLDDGVDVDHPNLKPNICWNPDPGDKRDRCGRDFYIPDDDDPDHFNPRPKNFQYPYNQMAGNDIHGTACAGLIAAAGVGSNAAIGAAARCRILPVKIFHAESFATDTRVADAIRYAALHADVISCSWTGPVSDDIAMAIRDASVLNRKGRGSIVICAAGNDGGGAVRFPASLPEAVAVGASTDQGERAAYSSIGPELTVVAPSSGGVESIYTTDVSYKYRGFNRGTAEDGGKNGLHTCKFGGTSAATAIAAGVAALVRSAAPNLSDTEVRQILCETADKIGDGYDPKTGQSPQFGHGRVNAAKAVAAAMTMAAGLAERSAASAPSPRPLGRKPGR